MKVKIFGFLVVLFSFLLLPNYVSAGQLVQSDEIIHVQMTRYNKDGGRVKEVSLSNSRDSGEGMHAVIRDDGGKVDAFCLDGTKNYISGSYASYHNALDYMSQSTLTKMAIYNDYVYNHQNIVSSKNGKYYIMQMFVWNILMEDDVTERAGWSYKGIEQYTKYDYGFYRITTDSSYSKNSDIVFGGGSDSEKEDKQNRIINEAKAYYEKNKNNFKGYGEVWTPYNGGQPVVLFSVKRIKYDYSIDAACENCDSKNTNGSYLIQDTTNWNNIFISPDASANPNAKSYYKKSVNGCNVFCREEYKVVFPNQNNQIYTEPGRYFTVNKQTTGIMYKGGVSNFKPIKVIKTRECRVSDGNTSCLSKFANQAKSETGSSAGKTGKISLKYKENYANTRYNSEFDLVEDSNRTTEKVSIDGSVMKAVKTVWYKLPSNTYRYVNIETGESAKNKPSDVTSHYQDIGTENLPVSMNNYATSSNKGVGSTISLKYSLPTDDKYSKLYKAFNANNNYFGDNSDNEEGNTYKKNDNSNGELSNSACAKLYGYGTSKYESCRLARTSNKAGKCYSSITEGKYTCDVKVCAEGETLCPDGTCSVNKECPNDGGPKCEIIDDKYYDKNGKEVTRAEYNSSCDSDGNRKCVVKNGKYYGQDGNEVTKEEYLAQCPNYCTVIDGKYYGKSGDLTTKSEYESQCGSNDWCKLCNGGKCCPDTDMVCPDENGECPTKGGNKIIYRTIDLNNPFPSQTGLGRSTGSNWCSYNVNTKKYTCANTASNRIVDKHILTNRNQKGYNVYNTTPLYEFTLDTNTIKTIKKYNKTHSYDDSDLRCTKGVCSSDFLRSVVKIDKGTCSKKSNLSTCAEVKS